MLALGLILALALPVAVIVLVILAVTQRSRLSLLEARVDALARALASAGAGAAGGAETAREAPAEPGAVPDADIAAAEPAVPEEARSAVAAPTGPAEPAQSEPLLASEAADEDFAGPWSANARAPSDTTAEKERERRDFEAALGARWAVWVGGLALALGGAFLVRYTIEAGIFGPGVRLTLAALMGFALVAGGEFIRRTAFSIPVESLKGASMPAILTAAGAFTLFGTVYAAHGIYGFIGPGPAFLLLGLIGILTIAAALAHGQALGGLGVVGSFAAPLLVASQAPNHWALFGFLAIVLAAAGAIARLRDWAPLMAAAFIGMGAWSVVYLLSTPAVDLKIVLFAHVVTLAVLAFVWLAGRAAEAEDGSWPVDRVTIAPALFGTVSAALLAFDPALAGGQAVSAGLLLAFLAAALYRRPALAAALLAGAAAAFIHLRLGFDGLSLRGLLWGRGVIGDLTDIPARRAILSAMPVAIAFLAAGLWSARRHAATAMRMAGAWSALAAVVPFALLLGNWVAFGDIGRDYPFALSALLLAGLLAAGGEWIARAEDPPLAGGMPVSAALAGSTAAAVLCLHMGFGPGMTTILIGALIAVPAHVSRLRPYPVFGWLCVALVAGVVGRIVLDPTIFGAAGLGTTPFFNGLLPGYGVPALAAGYAASQLARTTNGRPRLAMEAAAATFALLAAGMLVRHAMNGGIVDASRTTLAEQAIYTLIAIGGSAIMVALDRRAPSPVLRTGSILLGCLSLALIALRHFADLNPVHTGESTGRIWFFNLLFLAYLLPGAALAASAWYARGKRPDWYVRALALVAALLGFAYATLSVRRLFQGEYIALWKGFGQLEAYSYSALWLALGVALLATGVKLNSHVLRMASAVLVVVAVAKVFLFDMSALEGALRALSFIGLGVVLIGIGLFYQRMLTARMPSAR